MVCKKIIKSGALIKSGRNIIGRIKPTKLCITGKKGTIIKDGRTVTKTSKGTWVYKV